MIEVLRVGDGMVRLSLFEWGGRGKRSRILQGWVKIRWSEELGYGELVGIFVKPGVRRDGTGRALMFAAMNYFRREEIHRVFFALKPEADLSLEPFFKAMGFKDMEAQYQGQRQFMREIPMVGEVLDLELGSHAEPQRRREEGGV